MVIQQKGIVHIYCGPLQKRRIEHNENLEPKKNNPADFKVFESKLSLVGEKGWFLHLNTQPRIPKMHSLFFCVLFMT